MHISLLTYTHSASKPKGKGGEEVWQFLVVPAPSLRLELVRLWK